LELLELINGLGFGAAGFPGKTAIFDVHIEIAYTHTMGIPIGITNHCGCIRRATIRIYSNNKVELRPYPQWFTPYLRGM
jgi:tartrate dehydratase alpha subunit/fumarate hydratase class I-like protein